MKTEDRKRFESKNTLANIYLHFTAFRIIVFSFLLYPEWLPMVIHCCIFSPKFLFSILSVCVEFCLKIFFIFFIFFLLSIAFFGTLDNIMSLEHVKYFFELFLQFFCCSQSVAKHTHWQEYGNYIHLRSKSI